MMEQRVKLKKFLMMCQKKRMLTYRKKESDVPDEDESWLVSINEDSEPIELTKSEYLRKHPTKRPLKPIPNVSSGPWTSDGKRRKVNNVFSDLNAPINE